MLAPLGVNWSGPPRMAFSLLELLGEGSPTGFGGGLGGLGVDFLLLLDGGFARALGEVFFPIRISSQCPDISRCQKKPLWASRGGAPSLVAPRAMRRGGMFNNFLARTLIDERAELGCEG